MSKANPLTEEQKLFINENKGSMFVKNIADHLNTTTGKIWRYLSLKNKAELQETKKGYFNVDEKWNWLIG